MFLVINCQALGGEIGTVFLTGRSLQRELPMVKNQRSAVTVKVLERFKGFGGRESFTDSVK